MCEAAHCRDVLAFAYPRFIALRFSAGFMITVPQWIIFLDLAMPPSQATLSSPVLDLSLRKRLRYTKKPRMNQFNVSNGHSQQRPSFTKATYHPFLFAMITCSALAELGLTAFLVSAGNEHHTWPSSRYHALYDTIDQCRDNQLS